MQRNKTLFSANSKSAIHIAKLLSLVSLLLAPCPPAYAQQLSKIPRVGYISGEGDPNNPGPRTAAFRNGLHELGYVEGKNIQVDYRYILGQSGRIEGLVAELIQLKPDVLVTASLASTRAAKQQTKTIPIVFRIPDDPVLLGLVESLARPGGNITGVASLDRELSGKRLELLLEAIPTIKRVGLLYSPTGVLTAAALSRRNIKDYEIPAQGLYTLWYSAILNKRLKTQFVSSPRQAPRPSSSSTPRRSIRFGPRSPI